MRNIVVFGASRGLGAALVEGVPEPGDAVWCISRTRPLALDIADGVTRRWIAHDLAVPSRTASAVGGLADTAIDVLIYNAGIWETGPFEAVSDQEIEAIVATNLTSLLLATRHLLGSLRKAKDARVILIGSTCGLENEGTTSVAYAATKFAVRGAGHALRELLRSDGIAVSVISPGSMATDTAYRLGPVAALAAHAGKRIPVSDVVEIVRLICRLSPASCVKELDLPALLDSDV